MVNYTLAGQEEEARAEALEVLKINPKISLNDIAKNGYMNYRRPTKDRMFNALRNAGIM